MYDALLGAAIARDPQLSQKVREVRVKTWSIAAPDAAARLTQGLETLADRMQRHTESATEIVRRLKEHPRVELVRYPEFLPAFISVRRRRSALGRDLDAA